MQQIQDGININNNTYDLVTRSITGASVLKGREVI